MFCPDQRKPACVCRPKPHCKHRTTKHCTSLCLPSTMKRKMLWERTPALAVLERCKWPRFEVLMTQLDCDQAQLFNALALEVQPVHRHFPPHVPLPGRLSQLIDALDLATFPIARHPYFNMALDQWIWREPAPAAMQQYWALPEPSIVYRS